MDASSANAITGSISSHNNVKEKASSDACFQPKSNADLIPIYTDWANHYLEKGQKRRVILDLQKDMQDSVLLVDVVESVTGEKVPDVKRKPKNAAQVLENIGSCLQYLSNLGVNVDGLTAKDIRDGQLKSILGLFFSLSRYKQQQKSAAQQQGAIAHQSNRHSSPQYQPGPVLFQQRNQNPSNDMLSRLPSPFKPATATAAANCNGNSAQNSNALNHAPTSGIPSLSTPKHHASNTNEKKEPHEQSAPSKLAAPSGLKAPSVVVNGSAPVSKLQAPTQTATPATVSTKISSGLKPPSVSAGSKIQTKPSALQQPGSVKDSKMLEKLKLFGKDKTASGSASSSLRTSTSSSTCSTKSSVRTASSTCTTSSGFSSGKSELSDSTEGTSSATSSKNQSISKPASPKMSLKLALTKKTFAGKTSTASSPKMSRKEVKKETQTSPIMHRKISGSKLEDGKCQISSDDTDSAYAGCDSSPCSSVAPNQPQKKSSAENAASKLAIPKPTMAVKGTTKPAVPVRDESTRLETVLPASASNITKPSSLPKTSSRQKLSNAGSGASAEIADAATASATTTTVNEKDKFLQNFKSQRSYSNVTAPQPPTAATTSSPAMTNSGNNPISPSTGAVVGVVSPITHHKKTAVAAMIPSGGADLNSSLESTVGHQSDSNSSHTSGNQSDTASVIYCPSADEAAVAAQRTAGQCKLGSNRAPRSARSTSTNTNLVGDQKLREMSGSPAGRTQSRLETTFDSSDGVIVTTQTLTTTMGSDDEDHPELKKDSDHNASDIYDTPSGCCSSTGGAEEELANIVVEPMQPLLPRSSPYAYLKNYASAASSVGSTQTSGIKGSAAKLALAQKRPAAGHQEQQQANLVAPAGNPRTAVPRGKSPRLLLNKPLATLLHADPNVDASTALEAIRQAAASGDLVAGGYVSDGDALALAAMSNQPTSNSTAASGIGGYHPVGDLDISGYMSEGGISLYARKMQARFREGLEAVRDSMREKKSNHTNMNMGNFVDDSCEDSSSLSSGISEAFDEISTDDLTGSSLSDHAAVGGNSYCHPASNHKRQPNGRKTAESSQQTEFTSRQKQHFFPPPAGLDSRKSSDQYDRQKIDVLLQRSRTNARGQATDPGLGACVTPAGSVIRPKSEQMNMMMMNEIQLSADGQTLRVSASNFGYPQQSNGATGKRAPLSTNSLKIMKTDFSNYAGNPTIQQIAGHPPTMAYAGNGSGYHSLDRKKHLLTYHDVDPAAARYYYSDAESLYVNYGAVPRTSAGATLALVSPRRVPNGSVRRSDDGQQPPQQVSACWTRHSVAGQNNNRSTNGNQISISNGQPLPTSMSRSMIEPEFLCKPMQLQQSNDSPNSMQNASMLNGNHFHQMRMNGHARLSIPPQNVLQSGLMSAQSPRLARCTSTQSESGLPNQRKDGDSLSPSSQLYLHKLLANSPTSAGMLGIPESGHPPSPGSMSDRSMPNLYSRSHLNATPSPYAATVIGNQSGAEEVHASSLSLASTSSSVYSTAEEKYQAEIRKLHREVDNYRDKVQTLTTQQATYAHVVAAFEQSLQSMNKRVQNLTVAGEQKDFELHDLKHKIEALYQLSIAAGLNVEQVLAPSPSVQRRHTFNNNGNEPPGLSRQISSESMHSTVSQRSSLSGGSGGKSVSSTSSKTPAANANSSPTNSSGGEKKQKKSWLRSSFSKAFGKNKSKCSGSSPGKGNANGSISDVEESSSVMSRRSLASGDFSYPNSPVHQANRNSNASGQLKPAGSLSGLNECENGDPVDLLKRQLQDKDVKLTDVRLEALTSAHQIDQLKEVLNRMKMEMAAVKGENERLQRLLCSRSRAGSQTSLPLLSDDNESVSECGHVLSDMSVPVSVDATMGDGSKEGIRIQVSVSLDFSGDITMIDAAGELLIGSLNLSARAKWDLIDTFVFKFFKEYVLRIDPVSNLGLSVESIIGYQLGECQRLTGDQVPSISPGSVLHDSTSNSLKVALKGVRQNAVDSLAFETLIPKSIIQRYVHSLVEDKRIILCSLAGTGKTYLAKKLAQYLVLKTGKSYDTDSIAVFDGGESAASGMKSANEVKKFFQAMRDAKQDPVPVVVILDNLHNMGPLNDLFTGLSNVPGNCPYIIGTMSQSNHSTTTLQLQHNFRWHPCANHTEPIKGFLGRYLRRRLIESEVKRMSKYPNEICKILDWLPKVWIHLNKYLEVINSSEASIGPAQFMDCPLDIAQSRQWFVRAWNDSLSKYVREKANEGLHLYQKRASLEDPYEYVTQTWPWTSGDAPESVLSRIENESHSNPMNSFDGLGTGGGYRRNEYLLSDSEDPNDPDPLLMLMRLQEQAKSQKQNGSEFLSNDVPLRQEKRTSNGRQFMHQCTDSESTF